MFHIHCNFNDIVVFVFPQSIDIINRYVQGWFIKVEITKSFFTKNNKKSGLKENLGYVQDNEPSLQIVHFQNKNAPLSINKIFS